MKRCYVLLLALAAVGADANSPSALKLVELQKGTHLSKQKHLVSDDSVSDGEDDASEFGPGGCVKTWLNEEGHCMISTKCKDENITDYQVKLLCVDSGGERTRHVFNKGAFTEEESFDTLIMCKACLSEDEADVKTNTTAKPAADYSNATLADLVTEVTAMKNELKTATDQVVKLNKKVFGDETKTEKVLVHHTTERHTVSDAPVEQAQPTKRALRATPAEEPKAVPVVVQATPKVHSMAEAVALSYDKAKHQMADHTEPPRVLAKAQADAVQTQSEEDNSDDSDTDSSSADTTQASNAETSDASTATASEGEQTAEVQQTAEVSDDEEGTTAGAEEATSTEEESSSTEEAADDADAGEESGSADEESGSSEEVASSDESEEASAEEAVTGKKADEDEESNDVEDDDQ